MKKHAMKTDVVKFSLLLLCCLVCFGCNKGFIGLEGRVTFADNDEPLTRGTVAFESATGLSRGEIDENGNYRIGSFRETDGLPPGEYRVYLDRTERNDGLDKNGDTILVPLIDPKYSSPKTSGLSLAVDPSTRRYDIRVERASGVRGSR